MLAMREHVVAGNSLIRGARVEVLIKAVYQRDRLCNKGSANFIQRITNYYLLQLKV